MGTAPIVTPSAGIPPAKSIIGNPVIKFKHTHVDPPSTVYIAPDDFILLIASSNTGTATNVHVTGRLLRAPLPNWNVMEQPDPKQPPTPQQLDSEISAIDETITNIGGGTNASQVLNLAEGFLLSLAFSAAIAPTSGQWLYLQAMLIRGSLSSSQGNRVLFAGYLGNIHVVGWPDQAPQRSTDGAGTLLSITGSIPGFGAEISETVPFGRRWNLLAITATLATGVAVANRNVSFRLDDGANFFFNSVATFSEVASSSVIYTGSPNPNTGASLNGLIALLLPIPIPLRQSFRIRTSTQNLQGGDRWSAPQYLVQEWMETQ